MSSLHTQILGNPFNFNVFFIIVTGVGGVSLILVLLVVANLQKKIIFSSISCGQENHKNDIQPSFCEKEKIL